MTTGFSIKQVLACLNVSVFDPVVEPALKKACQIEEQEAVERKDPFSGFKFFIGMLSAALVCFFGFKSVPFVSGTLLCLICGAALYKTDSYAVRFFLRTYFLSGVFLLTYALFLFSETLCVFVLFIFLFKNIFSPGNQGQRIVLSLLLFICVCLATQNVLFISLGVFSVLGTIGVLCPVKNVYAWDVGAVFLIFPLLTLLFLDFLAMAQGTIVLQNTSWLSVFFAAEAVILLFCLRRDLNAEEFFWFILGSATLMLCGVFLSVGLSGSIALFLTAFFVDSPILRKVSVLMFMCFLLMFILFLPVSLFWAGGVFFLLACGFMALQYRLKQFEAK